MPLPDASERPTVGANRSLNSIRYKMKGKVQTVSGLVDPNQLGPVLPHEHMFNDLGDALHQEPLVKPHLSHCPFTLQNLGWIRQFPYSHYPNLKLKSPEDETPLMEDVRAFKAAGGGTLVDNTVRGMHRCPSFLKKVAQDTGVNIIAGTGFYLQAIADQDTLSLTVEQMVDDMTKELTVGCKDDHSVKCGILGEVGSSWPITDYEKRALRAAGEVEECLGCPVMIHPGRDPAAPQEALRIYTEAGGNDKRAVMAHLDRTFLNYESLDEFASSYDCFLEYDLFGFESSHYQQVHSFDMPSDAQRIKFVKHLIKEGHMDRIFISHDIHFKHRLEAYGGHGFSHILNTVRPMMVTRGITHEQINAIMVKNPANWLTFSK